MGMFGSLGLLQACYPNCGGPTEGSWTAHLTEEELAAFADADGNLSTDACARLCEGHVIRMLEVTGCGEPVRQQADTASDSGGDLDTVTVECSGTYDAICIGGRRPPALAPYRSRDPLLRAAWMEAASVHAFLRLHRELRHHGAPDGLAARCIDAARDEVRHARVMARRAGAPVPRPRVRPRPLRTLAALARDNAVEGCVHETWAAVVACLDPHPSMRTIARDETRHAQLAWDIDAWLGARARPDLRARAAARLVARVSLAHRPWAEALDATLWRPAAA